MQEFDGYEGFEEEPICSCDRCGYELYEDFEAYAIDGKIYCYECAYEVAQEWLYDKKIYLEKECFYEED